LSKEAPQWRYSGLNVIHQVGVGAARDARARASSWFHALDAFLNSLKSDQGRILAGKNIDQIGRSAKLSRTAFLEAVQRAGMEVYREPLTKSPVWSDCVSEWGRGRGFKGRVAEHLDTWFETNHHLKANLEEIVNDLWQQLVISPLRQLVEEGAPEETSRGPKVIELRKRASA
jgi:hypothetical protein